MADAGQWQDRVPRGRRPGQLVLRNIVRTPSTLLKEWVMSYTAPDRLRVFRKFFEEHTTVEFMADFLAMDLLTIVMSSNDSTALSKDMAELAMLGDYVVTLLHERIELAKCVVDGHSIKRRKQT